MHGAHKLKLCEIGSLPLGAPINQCEDFFTMWTPKNRPINKLDHKKWPHASDLSLLAIFCDRAGAIDLMLSVLF